MKIYDISVLLSENIPNWPGDPDIQLQAESSHADSGGYHLSRIRCHSHAGTHIDAPYHLLPFGTKLPQIPLEKFIQKAKVIEYFGEGDIPADFLRKIDTGGASAILFKTSNSRIWQDNRRGFNKDYVALRPESADLLVERKIELVGIDYFSIDPFDDHEYRAHKTFLKDNIVILENLDLANVGAGEYTLICMPLKVDIPDGAPVRAVLLDGSPG